MNDVLRLAVDARDLPSDTRGIGRYARAILRRLAEHPQIELTLLVHGFLPSRRRAQMRAALRSDRFRIASHVRGSDMVWHPANGTFFSSDLPSVVTIHDAVPFRFPDPDPKRRAHQQAPFLRSIREAKHFIAVSNFGRDELAGVFSLSPDRIDVIYHGVDPVFAPATELTHLPADLQNAAYLLYVGDTRGVEPRKNFPLLYEAYRAAFAQGAPPLVVVGPADPQLEGVRYAGLANGDAAGNGDGFLRDLYCGALALCVPSYHETFGMPAVEAMACGTPVVLSRASCLPEIAGDAALYADPHDSNDWARALRQLMQSPPLRARLREQGLAQARRYDWKVSAERHAQLFLQLARASTPRKN
jgi:glycosyltransferase involved in cell wall biosynthesis